MKDISLYMMSALYILAGINHFVSPRIYLRIMPGYIPFHRAMVSISGAVEIILGAMLLFPSLRVAAAWGIIILLIAVFPANVYHLTSQYARKGIPRWILIIRLPMQLVLILWAYWHTLS